MGTQCLSLEAMIALINLLYPRPPKPETIDVDVNEADTVSVLGGGCTDSNMQPESAKMASDSSRATTNTALLTNSTSERSSASGKATSSSSGGSFSTVAVSGVADYAGRGEEEDAESESDLSESGDDDILQPLRHEQPQQRRFSSDSESTATDLRSYGPGVPLDDKKYPLVSDENRPTTTAAHASASSKPKSRDEMTYEEIQAELKKVSEARAKCHFSQRTAYIKKEDKLRELLSKKREVRKPLRPVNRRR